MSGSCVISSAVGMAPGDLDLPGATAAGVDSNRVTFKRAHHHEVLILSRARCQRARMLAAAVPLSIRLL